MEPQEVLLDSLLSGEISPACRQFMQQLDALLQRLHKDSLQEKEQALFDIRELEEFLDQRGEALLEQFNFDPYEAPTFSSEESEALEEISKYLKTTNKPKNINQFVR